MSKLNQFVQGTSDASLVKSLGVQERQKTGPYTTATCYAVVFANNLKHIHFHIKGSKFDEIHNLTEDYYWKASNNADYLAELCMEKGQLVPNFCWASQLIPAVVADVAEYTYETAVTDLAVYMSTFISALENLRSVVPEGDVQSKLDDMIRDWRKELNYKNKQRFGEN